MATSAQHSSKKSAPIHSRKRDSQRTTAMAALKKRPPLTSFFYSLLKHLCSDQPSAACPPKAAHRTDDHQ
jgi:hypothetical protein